MDHLRQECWTLAPSTLRMPMPAPALGFVPVLLDSLPLAAAECPQPAAEVVVLAVVWCWREFFHNTNKR